jgi:phosphoglycolate phosphatase
MKKSFDTIIFDLDGTLVDTAPDVREGINGALEKMGLLPISMDRAKRAIGPGRDEFFRVIFQDVENPDVDTFIARFREIYWDHCLDRTKFFPGMDDVLNRLDGRTLVVASNKPKVFTEKILKGLGIRDRFAHVLGPEDVAHPKPHPEMVVKALSLAGGKPSKAMMVGDTANDLKAGRGAGVGLCGARYGYGNTEDLERMRPDFLIDFPLELMDIVEDHQG